MQSSWMKQEYSRLLLRLVSVRVVRLCDLTEEDAIASGAMGIRNERGDYRTSLMEMISFERGTPQMQTWIWALSVERIEAK